jgi:hypothetical protein
MKLKIQVNLAFILLLLFLFMFNVFSDDRTVSYESYVFESFDDDPLSRWIVRGSKNSDEGYPKIAKANIWPQALWGKNPTNATNLNVLGIKAKFTTQGYNYIEIVPAIEAPSDASLQDIIYTDAAGKKWSHNPLPFKGRAKSFDIWVWGSNYNYYLEVFLEDHNGSVYRLPLGDLNFIGWQNMSTEIPPSIPQSEKYIPSIRKLKLIKLMLWTRPGEKVNEFYVYLDQIKILTDLFESRFDGDELEDPDFLQEVWGAEE